MKFPGKKSRSDGRSHLSHHTHTRGLAETSKRFSAFFERVEITTLLGRTPGSISEFSEGPSGARRQVVCDQPCYSYHAIIMIAGDLVGWIGWIPYSPSLVEVPAVERPQDWLAGWLNRRIDHVTFRVHLISRIDMHLTTRIDTHLCQTHPPHIDRHATLVVLWFFFREMRMRCTTFVPCYRVHFCFTGGTRLAVPQQSSERRRRYPIVDRGQAMRTHHHSLGRYV